MTNKTVSILGCGWLGTAVAAHLIAKGYSVKGSTTSEARTGLLKSEGIEPYVITLSPQPSGAGAQEFFSSQILIVSIPPGRKSGSTAMYLERMKALSEHLTTTIVKHVLFVSSTAVYPDVAKEVTESDADPDSYLVQAERYFLEHSTIKTTIVRFGGLMGPGRHPGRFLAGKTGLTGADHPVNIIHQEDCVSIIAEIIETRCWGEILNACCDVHMRREDFYTAAAKSLHLQNPVFVHDQSFLHNANSSPDGFRLSSKAVNSGKLKRLLNFQFNNQLVLDLLKSPVG